MPDVTRDICVSNADENFIQNEFVWGAEEIGKIIGRSQRQMFNLVHSGQLKSVKKVGGLWVANREALRKELGAA